MSLNDDAAGGRLPGGVSTNHHQHPQATSADRLPVVFAVLQAVAGATFDRLLVRVCAFCRCAHLHHLPAGVQPTSIVRAPRCAPSRAYVAQVTDTLPAAAAAGQRRRAGAA